MHAGPRSSVEQILKILPVLLYALLMGMGMFSVMAAVVGPVRVGSGWGMGRRPNACGGFHPETPAALHQAQNFAPSVAPKVRGGP